MPGIATSSAPGRIGATTTGGYRKREQRFLSLQRQYPPNKDLWKVIVVLTRSTTRLEKEHHMLKQAREEQEVWKQQTSTIASVESDIHRMTPSTMATKKNQRIMRLSCKNAQEANFVA